MNNFIEKVLKSSLFSSIGLALLGLLLFFQSEITIISISYIIGGVLTAIGIIAFINFIKDKNQNINNELDIIYGIGMIILGIIVINNPKALASVIPFILGIIITFTSASKLQYSLELRKENNELWLSTMIFSLLTLLCGITLIFNPFSGAAFVTKIVGILLFVYAIIDITSTIKIRKKVNNIESEISKKTAPVQEAEVIEDHTEKRDRKKKSN